MGEGPSSRSLNLAIFLLLLVINGQSVHALYHSSSEILHWFSHAARKMPDKMRYTDLVDRKTRVRIPYASFTDYSTDASSRQQIIFVFGEHAREIITSEVALWMARLLLQDHTKVAEWPTLHSALERVEQRPAEGWPAAINAWLEGVLKEVIVQVIPIESIDSRKVWEEGSLCVRKSATNVDLNRNWPFAWKQVDQGDEQFGGLQPLSEPQSRLVKGLLDKHKTLGYVNVHSGEWALYTPWDSKPAYAPDLPADLPDLVDQLGTLCNCKAGPAGAVSGYLAFGSSMDYAYVHKKVPYPLTVEVYGGGNYGILGDGERNKRLTDYPLLFQNGTQINSSSSSSSPRHLLGSHPLLQGGNEERWRRLRQLMEPIASPAGDELMEMVAKASQSDRSCFNMFNPGDKDTYDKVVGDWLAAFVLTLRHMVKHGLPNSAEG